MSDMSDTPPAVIIGPLEDGLLDQVSLGTSIPLTCHEA